MDGFIKNQTLTGPVLDVNLFWHQLVVDQSQNSVFRHQSENNKNQLNDCRYLQAAGLVNKFLARTGILYCVFELRRSDLFVEIPESDEDERRQRSLFVETHVTILT